MIKCLDDYLDNMQKLYPLYTREQLSKILKCGFSQLYYLTSHGLDVVIQDGRYRAALQRRYGDIEKIAAHVWDNRRKRIRLMLRKKTDIYDGYYYFSLTDEEWEKYKKTLTVPGKVTKFSKIVFWRLKEDAFIGKSKTRYFKAPFPCDLGACLPIEHYEVTDAEMIAYKDKDKNIIFL